MLTFTWVPSYSSKCSRVMSVSEVKFGDGYTQRTTDLCNNQFLRFQLSFTKLRSAEALAIDAFISSHGGKNPFAWNPPAPYNYSDSPTYSAIGYAAGTVVKSGLNVYQCLQTHASAQALTNAAYWQFVTRLPLIFVCKQVDSSPEQFDSNTLSLVFEQVFNPQ